MLKSHMLAKLYKLCSGKSVAVCISGSSEMPCGKGAPMEKLMELYTYDSFIVCKLNLNLKISAKS